MTRSYPEPAAEDVYEGRLTAVHHYGYETAHGGWRSPTPRALCGAPAPVRTPERQETIQTGSGAASRTTCAECLRRLRL